VIKHLQIKNFAIIEEISVSFESGLTIITGETGAGKSILIGALSLILGDRADTQSILNPAEKCILEATFNISKIEKAKFYLQQLELYEGDELIIRRELSNQGKSRVFINDSPTTLTTLQSLANLLIDLHRQFDTIELQQESFQLELIDEISNHEKEIGEYKNMFQEWKNCQQAHEKLIASNVSIKQELDYHQFLFQELENFCVTENEIEHAENEIDILNQSEALKANLQKIFFTFNESDTPLIASLKTCILSLEPFEKNIQAIADIATRLRSSMIELKDINADIEHAYSQTSYDEEKINFLQDRINEGNRLLKKHHVKASNELIELQNKLAAKILQATTADEEETMLKSKKHELKIKLVQRAERLSKLRANALGPIEEKVNHLLKKVGMPNAQLKILQTIIEPSLFGIDKIEFLFDANKTGKFQPIGKVASGGELSRLMLCVKSLLAKSTAMPTLIFDEIDTGISGETAIQVGQIMKELATQHQLICITHLPQIASKANQHLYIFKYENKSGSMNTQIKQLNNEERVDVLAEMLSGKTTDTHSKQMVKTMMQN
jgi:DNA repair protein RecN (Recombination protein N)